MGKLCMINFYQVRSSLFLYQNYLTEFLDSCYLFTLFFYDCLIAIASVR